MPRETTGLDWTADELAVIVSDYFSMLRDELEGRPYSKSAHRRVLLQLIRRSDGSVEFKHQNVSAVLQELGLPWIAGYKPRSNYQQALLEAIEEQLSRHSFVQEIAALPLRASDLRTDAIFVPSPTRMEAVGIDPGLSRLIRKFDPAARDARNRGLGKAGEAFVLDLERRRLEQLGRRELAERVRWIAEADGDGAGYDILSFDPDGGERLLEVKTTCGAERTPFYLTRNELALAEARPSDFRLVRVHQFANDPKVFVLTPPLSSKVRIEPIAYRAGWD